MLANTNSQQDGDVGGPMTITTSEQNKSKNLKNQQHQQAASLSRSHHYINNHLNLQQQHNLQLQSSSPVATVTAPSCGRSQDSGSCTREELVNNENTMRRSRNTAQVAEHITTTEGTSQKNKQKVKYFHRHSFQQ